MLNFSENSFVTEEQMRRMGGALRHRGPDDEGIYLNPERTLGLAHRRLSIIDLSSAGHQPMSNENGSVWIVFNGEIYNYQLLRSDLENRGHIFRSHTDTETIIHLWEEHGVQCLQYLRGMFSFALWDENKKQLFLARDRLGKKPLKYFIDNHRILFASELKAILSDPTVPREIDHEAIYQYLIFQYVPSPNTGFVGIKKLPAAHYLTVDCSDSTPVISGPIRYWKIDYSHKQDFSTEEWQEKILRTFDESVQMRMISDVPLGAFLSGGVDSSAVVALMSRHSDKKVKTFSIGFEEQSYNELPYARLLSERYATDHHEFIVRPNAIEILPQLAQYYEEPYADSSALPTWYLSKLTREHVTVALNGDGGDENFAGYGLFPVHWFGSTIYRHIPALIRRGLIRPATAFLFSLTRSSFLERCNRFDKSFDLPAHARYMLYNCYFTPEQLAILASPSFRQSPDQAINLVNRIFNENTTRNPVEQALYFNMISYLADDLLPKVDIATMAFGLEGRSPLLDHIFVELVASMPVHLKMNRLRRKYIFKRLLRGIVPNEILFRRKQGFGIPLDRWFRTSLKSYTEEILLDPKSFIATLFVQQKLKRFLDDYQRSTTSLGRTLWALITLELWWRTYFYGR